MTKEEYIKEMRKYPARNVARKIAVLNNEMFESKRIINKVDWHKFTRSGKFKVGEIGYSPWILSSMMYYASYSNDYRGTNLNNNEFFSLVNKYHILDEWKSKYVNDRRSTIDFLLGTTQKQFVYQKMDSLTDDFSRNYEILVEIPRKYCCKLNTDIITKEIYGISSREYFEYLLLVILQAHNYPDMDLISADFSSITEYRKDCYCQIIKQFAVSYQDIREDVSCENFFVKSPIVHTNYDEYIAFDIFVLFMKLNDGLYWLIRNYYHQRRSNIFVNEFGVLFEYYFEDLISTYLPESVITRINRKSTKTKRADWIIETENYTIIIEQKSCLAKLDMKNDTPNEASIGELCRKFIGAIMQLDSSRKNDLTPSMKSKKIILLVVHYEKLYLHSQLRERMKISKYFKSSLSGLIDQVYFMNISEFEKLIALYKLNNKLFSELLDKIYSSIENQIIDSMDFENILSENKEVRNHYLRNKINHMGKLMNEMSIKLPRSKNINP